MFPCSAFALFTLILGTNIPSPFYALYADRFGFSPLVLTLIFAAYAAALIPTLLLAGSLADAFGYRRVLLPGLVVATAATLVFAYAGSVGMLLLARMLQGVAVGVSSGALTAALARTAPAERSALSSMIASAVTTAGGGLGPVLAGLCAAVLPAPTRTSYLIEAGALLLAAAGLFTLPTSLGRTTSGWRPRPPRLPPQRAAFLSACAVSFTGWAVTAVFLSIVPTYVTTLTGNASLPVAGAAAGLVLVVAALVQPMTLRLSGVVLELAGLASLALGLVLLLTAGFAQSFTLVLIAAATAGAGQGMGFMGAMRESARTSPRGAEAATASGFYVATYLGVGVPTIGVGLLATLLGTVVAVDAFAALIAAVSVVLAIFIRSGCRGTAGVASRSGNGGIG
jgi:MFS family permease